MMIYTIESDEEIEVNHSSDEEDVQDRKKANNEENDESDKESEDDFEMDFDFGDRSYKQLAKKSKKGVKLDNLVNVDNVRKMSNVEKRLARNQKLANNKKKDAEDNDEDEEAEEQNDEEDSDDEENGMNEEEEQAFFDKVVGSKKKNATTVTDKKSTQNTTSTNNEEEDMVMFSQLNLSRPILRAIEKAGYVQPTKIQSLVIPYALAGRDICASAVTGSGKTAAFVLPFLERLLYRPKENPAIRVLIITPTRELAMQIHNNLMQLSSFTDVTSCLICGGKKDVKSQEATLRNKPDVLICTPGRMLDHLRNSHAIHIDELDVLVLDEADRLLELGFQGEIEEILKYCPISRQTMLFSATMTPKVEDLIKLSLRKPIRVKAEERAMTVAPKLIQEFVKLRNFKDQEAMLLALICRGFNKQTIVFFDRKSSAQRFHLLLRHTIDHIQRLNSDSALTTTTTKKASAKKSNHKKNKKNDSDEENDSEEEDGDDDESDDEEDDEEEEHVPTNKKVPTVPLFNSATLHGDLPQQQRDLALQRFRNKDVDVLIATDVAARGLDITGVQTVINAEMPNQANTYIHRVGRTARAGLTGRAITFVSDDRRSVMKEVIKSETKKQNQPQGATTTDNATKSTILARTIPAAVVKYYSNIIAQVQGKVAASIKNFKAEMELEKMEESVNRAENILKYQEEIKSRPARTWFQSSTEKVQISQQSKQLLLDGMNPKKRGLDQDDNNDSDKDDDQKKQVPLTEAEKKQRQLARSDNYRVNPDEDRKLGKKRLLPEKDGHRMSREKRRRMEAVKEEEQERQERIEKGENNDGSGILSSVKKAKNKEREKRQNEKSAGEMGMRKIKVAISEGGPPRKVDMDGDFDDLDDRRPTKTKIKVVRQKFAVGGLDTEDFMGGGGTGMKASKRDKLAQKELSAFKEFDPNKHLRKGGKQSRASFKSKGKFKRRK